MIAGAFVWMTMVAPVAGAEPTLCFDPEGVEIPFICGELGLILKPGFEDSVDMVLERSAPEATVLHRAADLRPPGSTVTELDYRVFALSVPVGEEIRIRNQLVADTAVEDAQLGHFGHTATPNTAVKPAAATTSSPGIGLVLILIGGALLAFAPSFRRPAPSQVARPGPRH